MKIVAIGGGEIGRPGYPIETTEIDQEIINLTGKKNPNLLFLPTASGDSGGYVEVVNNYFGKRFGCKIDVLYLLNGRPEEKELEEKFSNTDIIYVGGGNTLKMMQVWRKHGIDELIKKAGDKGVVLSGVSAGAVCWFEYACSDSRIMNNPNADYIKVKGLGFIKGILCPHYGFEPARKMGLKKMIQKSSGMAIALDNCCALEIVDDKYRLVKSKKTAKAYKCFWKNGQYFEEEIIAEALSPQRELFSQGR
jgi:dipeptidase E